MIWRKNSAIQRFPKVEKNKNYDFTKSTENTLKMNLRPKLGDFGEK